MLYQVSFFLINLLAGPVIQNLNQENSKSLCVKNKVKFFGYKTFWDEELWWI